VPGTLRNVTESQQNVTESLAGIYRTLEPMYCPWYTARGVISRRETEMIP